MSVHLSDRDWENLIHAINKGQCTPFLGAGVSAGVLPLGGEIARVWSAKFDYPLEDKSNLIKVAQFLAIDNFPMFPKDQIVSLFEELSALPNFSDPHEPHRVLAELPLPVYLTTNYDNFMMLGLERKRRDAKREICRWNTLTRREPTRFDNGYQPSVANPVVFHLHGHTELPTSMVLTEDDYFDFLVNISTDPHLIPPRIQKALTDNSVLFIGYGLADWNFRVLLQGLSRFMERGLGRHHFAVMMPPTPAEPRDQSQSDEARERQQQKVQKYLADYYRNIDVRVFWGTAHAFCTELKERWSRLVGANG